jgi:hypothetical protein
VVPIRTSRTWQEVRLVPKSAGDDRVAQGGGTDVVRACVQRKRPIAGQGLNDHGIPTAHGSGSWATTQVARVLERL